MPTPSRLHMPTQSSFVRALMPIAFLAAACSSSSSDGGAKDAASSSSGKDAAPSTGDAGHHEADAGPPETGTSGHGDASARDAGSAAPTWTFTGGETTLSLQAGKKPGLATIAAGGDVSARVTLQFAAPTASGSLTLATAENGCCGVSGSDVSPSTLPMDDSEDLSASATPGSMGDPTLYLSFYNTGSTAISFASTPAVTIQPTDGGLLSEYIPAMDECQLDLYLTDATGKRTWTAIPSAVMMLDPEATTVTIPSAALPDGGVLELAPGQLVGGIACD